MEKEDSTNALFEEPNAYIQKCDKCKDAKTKRVVFQQPYENLPNYYPDYGFCKDDCKCVCQPKPQKNNHCNEANNFLNIKSFLPLLTGLLAGKGNGLDVSNLMTTFAKLSSDQPGVGDIGQLIKMASTLLSKNNSILDIFKSKKKSVNMHDKNTDFCIKNYTKVID